MHFGRPNRLAGAEIDLPAPDLRHGLNRFQPGSPRLEFSDEPPAFLLVCDAVGNVASHRRDVITDLARPPFQVAVGSVAMAIAVYETRMASGESGELIIR